MSLFTPPVHAADIHGDFSLLGQVRDGDQSRKLESPQDLYGDLGVSGLPSAASADTYFRLEHDFGSGQGPTEFYAGALKIPMRGAEFTLGRQFVSEVPGGVFIIDGGKARLTEPGSPITLTAFAGVPRYFEPTFSSESQSQDETAFGGSVRTNGWKHGYLSVGFLEQQRNVPAPAGTPLGAPNAGSDERVIRQLISATGSRTFTALPGLPTVYSTVSLDAKRQNIDQATVGADAFLVHPRLSVNFESTYYKPQNQGERLVTDINRREDAIFELFSLSDMLQFRGGLRYSLNRSLSLVGDYSYQRYEQLDNNFVNGHVGSAGILWLPGGDGLEVVRLEYYVLDSSGGNVNGGRLYYENRVYDRLLFHTKVDVAYYEKQTNERSTPVSTFVGLGYVLTPDLVGEVNMEANRNQRFNADLRFGFMITYKFHQAAAARPHSAEAS